MYRRRAAEAERRQYVIDPSPNAGSRRGNRLLVGCILLVWFVGSVAIAYWLGEPYLRSHRDDVDPVQARLMAEALHRKEAEVAAVDPAGQPGSDADRIQTLEQRIADAVTRIDEIRSDAVPAAFNDGLRSEVATLRAQVAESNREINRLRDDVLAINLPPTESSRPVAGAFTRSDHTSDDDLSPVSSRSAATSNDARHTRYWAMGAVALSLIANMSTLLLYLRTRRTTQLSKLAADGITHPDVRPGDDHCAASSHAPAMTTPAGAKSSSPASAQAAAHDAGEMNATAQMIAEMRQASVAGVEAPQGDPEQEAPSLILVDEDDDYLATRAVKISVVAENRLGLDFAVRITDRERAGLAGRRIDGDEHRSVA